jgi:NADPH:quinone reductase-like Zn-dependent oxidoreductase
MVDSLNTCALRRATSSRFRSRGHTHGAAHPGADDLPACTAQIDIFPGEFVVVLGLGVTGQLHVQLAKARGATVIG